MEELGGVLGKTIEAAAKEAASGAGAWIMAAAGLGTLSAPTGAVAGAALQALAAALLKQAGSTEKKLDRLLKEPWQTGSRELLEALKLPASGPDERRLRSDRVRDAVGRLETAATHAEQAEDEPLRLMISSLQALGFASLPGGGPSARRRLAPLKARAAALRSAADEAERRSRAPETLLRAPRYDAIARLGELREGPRKRFDDEPGKTRAAELREDAARLRADASSLERFCRLVEAASRRR